ncbi:MAG: acyl-CoA carboxylase subunit beta [Candidatus Methanofastidiosia archaeon]
MKDKVSELERKKERIKLGGGEERIKKQHLKGKLTARERLELFFDEGSFVELDMFVKPLGREFGMDKRDVPADGIVIGYGKVDSRYVAAFAEDFTCMAGTYGEMHGRKMCKIIEFALHNGMPVVGFNDSGGARLQENMGPLSEYGHLFYLNSIASGVVPQIAAIMGPVAGGQAYSPGLNDFIVMVKKHSYTFIAGPPLVEAVLGEKASVEELGGPEMHSSVSGVCHLVTEDDYGCIEKIKELLSYLPQNNREKPPSKENVDDPNRTCEGLYDIVPRDRNIPYNMHDVILEITDEHEFFEIYENYRKNMICGFARFNGHPVGIYANNPLYMAGTIDVRAAEKASRFVRFCDAFNIPLLSLVDTPAYLVGTQQERKGIIYRGAKLLFAISEATVPQITIYIGKGYAGGYLAMGSKDFKIDFVFAWPTAEIALVGPEGTVNVIYRKEIASAKDPRKERRRREEEFRKTYMSIYYPASLQHIDDIIDPKDTRKVVIKALEALSKKKVELPWRKHGNMPL